MEAYTDSGEAPAGEPVADVTYNRAIRLRIYGRTTKLHRAVKIEDFQVRLDEMPHKFRLDVPARTITYYNRVLIEKIDSSPMFDNLKVGQTMMANVGNMPCDLILDALTISFAENKGKSSKGVQPEVLLPYLGGQYGAGLLSQAVSWRLVDRGLGWPSGDRGETAALKVAETLQRQCLESPTHLQHGWCILDLRKLAENAKSDKINEILAAVEAEVADDLRKALRRD